MIFHWVSPGKFFFPNLTAAYLAWYSLGIFWTVFWRRKTFCVAWLSWFTVLRYETKISCLDYLVQVLYLLAPRNVDWIRFDL